MYVWFIVLPPVPPLWQRHGATEIVTEQGRGRRERERGEREGERGTGTETETERRRLTEYAILSCCVCVKNERMHEF